MDIGVSRIRNMLCFMDQLDGCENGCCQWQFTFLPPNRVPNTGKFDDFPNISVQKICTFLHQKVASFDPKLPTSDDS